MPPLPWHLINIWWTLAGDVPDLRSLQMEVSISRDMPAAAYNLYIAPVSAELNGASFYGGLQTNVGGYPAANPDDRSGPYHHGKGGIFSRWGESLDLSFVRAEPGGFVEAAGYEGDFVSGRRVYPWKAGTYIFEIRRASSTLEEGKDWVWAEALVTDKATGARITIAELKFPGKTLRLGKGLAAFIEFYGGKDVDIPNLPPLEIRLRRPRINGKPGEVKTIKVHHPLAPTELGAPALMTAELSQDGQEVVCVLHDSEQAGRAADYQLSPAKHKPFNSRVSEKNTQIK